MKNQKETISNSTNSNNQNISENQNLISNNEDKEIISFKEALKGYNRELLFYEKLERSEQYKKCSYEKGKIEQEIYFCKTCYEETKKYGVICLGCYFHCHSEHEIINLYFKRNLKCDCGNSHFNINCNLNKEKDYENFCNNYNHNFEGKFCYCNLEDDGNEMIQCFFCEDWFHLLCVNIYSGNNNLDKGEFVCRNCLNMFSFLFENYDMKKFVFGLMNFEDKNKNININENNENNNCENNKNDNRNNLLFDNDFGKKRKHNEIEIENEIDLNNNICKLKKREFNFEENKKILNEIISNKNEIIISTKILEKMLCYCEDCKLLYKGNNLDFLNTKNFYTEWYKRVLFEDKINEEVDKNSEENIEILNNINNIDLFKTKEIKALDVEKQIELSLVSKEFVEEFTKYIYNLKQNKEKSNSDFIITYEDVNDFLIKFQSHLLK